MSPGAKPRPGESAAGRWAAAFRGSRAGSARREAALRGFLAAIRGPLLSLAGRVLGEGHQSRDELAADCAPLAVGHLEQWAAGRAAFSLRVFLGWCHEKMVRRAHSLRLVRIPRRQAGAHIDPVLTVESAEDLDPHLEPDMPEIDRRDARAFLGAVFWRPGLLEDAERRTLSWELGLNGHGPASLSRVARGLGVTRSVAEGRSRAARRKLRAALLAIGIRCPDDVWGES